MENDERLCCTFHRNTSVFCKNHEFEELLRDTLRIAQENVHAAVLNSNELVTEFTIPAEQRTEALNGIPIDSRLTKITCTLRCGCIGEDNCTLNQQTAQLIEHIIREANHYIRVLETGRTR